LDRAQRRALGRGAVGAFPQTHCGCAVVAAVWPPWHMEHGAKAQHSGELRQRSHRGRAWFGSATRAQFGPAAMVSGARLRQLNAEEATGLALRIARVARTIFAQADQSAQLGCGHGCGALMREENTEKRVECLDLSPLRRRSSTGSKQRRRQNMMACGPSSIKSSSQLF
jgi:hypothetical protein